MATLTTPGFTPEAFDAFLANRQEPDWLVAARKAAWQTFMDLPMPNTRQEEWRRTDLRLFKLDKFGIPGETTVEPLETSALLSHGVELAGQSVTVNSVLSSQHLDPALAKQGVLFGPLSELANEHSELIESTLMSAAFNPEYDRFAALNAAVFSGGMFVYIPDGVKVELPLHLLTQLRDGGTDLGHTLIVLGRNAVATILVETLGDDSECLHCGGIEILQGENSRLRFVSLQNWGAKTWHFAHQKAVLGAGARLQWTIGALGSRLAKVNQHVALDGKGAAAQVNGVMFTEGKQHINYHTLQHHQAPETKSDLLYEGALQDRSQIVWRGMIKVDPVAQKTDGYQRNDNLVLSRDARADSIPGLEIEADDVMCTHGATAGMVDDELIFYCQARGLTRQEAIRTVVAGFFQKVFDRITIESVKEALTDAIGQRIREFH